MKYKVLLPTNGWEKDQVVDITEEEANAANAGETSPRLEAVAEESTTSGEGAVESQEEGTAEVKPDAAASEEGNQTASQESTTSGEGAGADTATGSDQGGNAENQSA